MTVFEKKNDDRGLPFIDYGDMSIRSAISMITVAIVVFISYIYISAHPQPLTDIFGKSELSLVFILIISTLIPLAIMLYSFYYFSNKNLRQYFQGNPFKEWKAFVAFFLMNAAYGILSSQFVSLFARTVENKGISNGMNLHMYLISVIEDVFSLATEELYAIPLFFAFAVILSKYFKWSRNVIIYVALLISAVLFGLAHFETYSWNLTQMIFVVGLSRFFITGAYIRTKNMWVAYAIHFMTDFIITSIAFLV
ncbi:CPBP family intramembrane metalloprotease [Weissella muntiaci]|uniref:CPBP family intramembrane metalloprotease n=1 Tax=Weissella muntiaci TaxID=2508881 RepID=A0A6C2C6Q7_9LACO|nr:CPBP family intramembrane glutamic endopeptidase [Weissella muntiaci]TYC49620.1 CPBP family intramembrane metalloprotease [Weissella muntiaci]